MKQERRSYYPIIITALVFLSSVLLTYLLFFFLHIHTPNDNDGFTYSKSDLGTLGDLIGGVLNPLLTFITIGLLLWSIRIQGKELGAATEQSKKSAIALQQTQKIHEETMRRTEREQIFINTKEKFDEAISKFDSTVSANICSVNYRSESGKTLYTQFSLLSVTSYSDTELSSISDVLKQRNDMRKVTNELKRLELLSQSITIHAMTYIKYDVPSIYYGDDFLKYHGQLNRLYANLTAVVGESNLTEISYVLSQNELLVRKIMSIQSSFVST